MPNQSASNTSAAIKRELAGTPGTPAVAGAGGMQLRLLDSPGLKMERTPINSAERRVDRMAPMGRLGSRSVNGSFNTEATVGGATDDLLSAILRNSWTAALAITNATPAMSTASITTSANAIIASAGSWLTSGVRLGDIVTLTGHSTAANNDKRLQVVAVSALTLQVAGTPLTANAVADTAWTLTVLKKVTSPLGVPPTRVSYSVEQYYADLDQSELFVGCRLTGVAISMRPNTPAGVVYTFMGMDRQVLATGTSPWFTAPSLTTGLALVSDDSSVVRGGVVVGKFTSLDLRIELAATGTPVLGSTVTPDIFDNVTTASGSISMIRDDFSRITSYEAETEFELSAWLSEPTTDPKPGVGLYVPRAKFRSLDAPFMGGDGPMIETLDFMAGPEVAGSGRDGSGITFFSTAA